MVLKPVLENIVVKILDESKNNEGLYLPNTDKDKPQTAIVISVNENNKNQIVKPNQKIIFEKFCGYSFKINDEDFTLINQNDILAIIE
jgi:chaperonin GroES